MEMMEEHQIIALYVMEGTSHPRVALAEPEVIGRVGLGGLAVGPIPVAAVLEVDDVEAVAADDCRARPEAAGY